MKEWDFGFWEQLAEDHLAHLTMLLNEARACLAIGMDRAGFATPGKRAVIHQQVGNHAIYMMSPPDGKDIIMLNRLKCKHASKLVDCRVDHNSNHQEASQTGSTPKSALKTTATKEQPAKTVALKDTRTMDTVFIGGGALAEMKEEIESYFQDIS